MRKFKSQVETVGVGMERSGVRDRPWGELFRKDMERTGSGKGLA